MTQPTGPTPRERTEEQRNRERKLDDTLEDSFPASDPPSTTPNPDDHGADDHESGVEAVTPEPPRKAH